MKHIYDMYQTIQRGRAITDSNKEVRTRINALSKEVTGMSDYEVATNAILIDNVERHVRETARMKGMTDSVFSQNFGPYLRHVLNLASTVYSTFELKNIISVQPLEKRIGALYYPEFTYGSTKGDVESGDKIFSPFGNLKRNGTYTSEIVKNEIPGTVTAGSLYAVAFAPIYDPNNKQFSKANISIKFVDANGVTRVFSYGNPALDSSTIANGKAVMVKTGVGTMSLDLADGTLAYTTDGETIALDSAGVTTLRVTYTFNSERAYRADNTRIPKMSLNVIEELVTAQPRQLIFETNLLASYDFDKQFGSSLNATMESAALLEMQNSLAFQVLDEMWAGAQIASDYNPDSPTAFDIDFAFTTGVTPFIPLTESFQAILLGLSRMSTAIRAKYGRGLATFVIGGSNLEALLRVIPDTYWKAVSKPDLRGGPYLAGRLANSYDVYINYGYDPEDLVVGYKGSDWWEASYFIGSYLPIMAGEFMMFPDFKGQQGYYAVEALKNIFPHMCVRGTLNLVQVGNDFPVKVKSSVDDPIHTLPATP